MKLTDVLKKNNTNRYNTPDNIRGIVFISMFLYHLVWDLVNIYVVDWYWYKSDLAFLWQQSICWTFILLSGFCFYFGNNRFKKLKRGIVVTLASVLVSLITIIFMPDDKIIFGVLTLIGASMIFSVVLEPLISRLNPYAGAIISFLLFVFLYNVPKRTMGVFYYRIIGIPDCFYRNYITTFFGFMHKGFYSSDYFPLIPWFFLFLTGFFLHGILKRTRNYENILRKKRIPVLNFIGKHSLILYLLHQPLIYAILILVFDIIQ